MNTIIERIIIILIVILYPVHQSMGGGILKVKEIHFIGLKNISKYEIIKKAGVRADNDGILADISSLENVLKKSDRIKSYQIINKGNRIIIKVEEKNIFITVIMNTGGKLIPVDLSSDYRIISKKSLYNLTRPLIFVSKEHFRKGFLKEKIKKICEKFKDMKRDDTKLYDEISEIHIRGAENLRLVLTGRNTEFQLKPNSNYFARLKFLTGYFDRIQYYPERVIFTDNEAVLR